MADDLRIGVIGAGGRGRLADHAHKPGQGARLVAGADQSPQVLRSFKEKYGPDVFVTADYRELLARKDIDAVFVATPDFLHEEHAVAALSAGKAVYLEKPMAITIEGCDAILRAAKQSGARLYLGHNMRHMPFTRKMKELIDGGAIGEVTAGWCRHFIAYGGDAYFKDWHADRRTATSLLLQKGAHDIDILHWLCGGRSVTVHAMGALTVYGRITDRHPPEERGDASWHLENWPPLSQKGLNPVVDVEDLSMMQMRLDNGAFCSYQQCHYTPDAWRNYTIIGTEGRIENFGTTRPAPWCACGTSARPTTPTATSSSRSRSPPAATAAPTRASSTSSCASYARAGAPRPARWQRATASPPACWPPTAYGQGLIPR